MKEQLAVNTARTLAQGLAEEKANPSLALCALNLRLHDGQVTRAVGPPSGPSATKEFTEQ